jgi:hypothetical protein
MRVHPQLLLLLYEHLIDRKTENTEHVPEMKNRISDICMKAHLY